MVIVVIAIVAALGLIATIAITVLETANAASQKFTQGQRFKIENLTKRQYQDILQNNP
jgi:hypothetical protein